MFNSSLEYIQEQCEVWLQSISAMDKFSAIDSRSVWSPIVEVGCFQAPHASKVSSLCWSSHPPACYFHHATVMNFQSIFLHFSPLFKLRSPPASNHTPLFQNVLESGMILWARLTQGITATIISAYLLLFSISPCTLHFILTLYVHPLVLVSFLVTNYLQYSTEIYPL